MTEASRRWRVEGPVPGLPTLLLGSFDLGLHGYVVEEYFLDGTATCYEDASDGARPAGTAPFRTRFVVVRPADATSFSGTVVARVLTPGG